MHHRVVSQSFDAGLAPARVAPVRSFYARPPGRPRRSAHDVLIRRRYREAEHRREAPYFRFCAVSGCRNEAFKVAVRRARCVDRERFEAYFVHRFFTVAVIRPHVSHP